MSFSNDQVTVAFFNKLDKSFLRTKTRAKFKPIVEIYVVSLKDKDVVERVPQACVHFCTADVRAHKHALSLTHTHVHCCGSRFDHQMRRGGVIYC